MHKPSIAIVGHGNLGRVLAGALKNAGYKVTIVPRGSRSKTAADVVWLCVPDRSIAAAARELATRANWKDRIVVHSSGALPASILSPLRKAGASVASAHPMNSFVEHSAIDLIGVPFAFEGEARALRTIRDIVRELTHGAPTVSLEPEQKVLYHAMGAFASPLIIVLLSNAEQVGKAAGIRDPRRYLSKILQTTLANYLHLGAAAAFSGPIARGDSATVKKHLLALKKLPRTRAVYRALLDSALAQLPTKLQHKPKKD